MATERLLKEKLDEKYNWQDLPKVSNWISYSYHIFFKIIWTIFLSVGAIFLSLLFFPILRIFIHPAEKFRGAAQKLVSASFNFFLILLRVSGFAKLITESRKEFHNLHSKIIVANHPSLLDTVILISLIPNSTMITGHRYSKGVFGGVVKTCYMTNSLDFDELCKRCKENIESGGNVIIFPEGTRSPRHGQIHYKKGAARIARTLGANIIPVLIAGSDKFGLGKYNPILSYNPVEELIYHVIKLEEINISDYSELTDTISAKRVTQQYETQIREAAEAYKKDHPLTKTVNNV